jgi:hypothetical protein
MNRTREQYPVAMGPVVISTIPKVQGGLCRMLFRSKGSSLALIRGTR